jgi:hypothetical protein
LSGTQVGVAVLAIWATFVLCDRQKDPVNLRRMRIADARSITTASTVFGLTVLTLLWSVKTNPLSALTHLFPEDNAGWLIVATASVGKGVTAEGFVGGGNSPIVGVLSSVLSLITKYENDLKFTSSFKSLLIVQNAYIITILYSSYLSGKIASRVIARSEKFAWWQAILPSCSSVFTFSLLSAAFIEYGHLSFILSAMFGLTFIYSQTKWDGLPGKSSGSKRDYLRLLGFGLAWWPMLPISCLMILCLFFWNIKENRDKPIKPLQRFSEMLAILLTLISAYFAYRSVFKTGFSFAWPTQSDGGVLPLNGLLVIVLTILIFSSLISPRNQRFKFPISRFGRLFFLIVIVFYGFLRITNEFNVGYQSYGSRKTLFLLLVLTVPVFFFFLAQIIDHVTAPLEYLIICLGVLLIMLSSTTGFRYFKEPSTGNSTTGYAEYLTDALEHNPNSLILCVNSDPLQADLGYYCNRMASALTIGDSSLSFNWGQAMLNPDKTPYGNVIQLSETYGERAKVAFNHELNSEFSESLKILIFPPIQGDLTDFVWDEGRWWLNDIEWTNYLADTKQP